MNVLACLLALVVAAGAAGAAGVVWGTTQGRAQARAEHDAATLQQLGQVLQGHQAYVERAQAASRRMRAAAAQRAQADTRSNQELRDALIESAGVRAGCVFPAGVMQQLEDARDRAAQAAASGLLGALPGPAAGAAGQR